MHSHTIAIAIAMAGSCMAAVLQSPPSTTTVYTTKVRAYGPTCAGIGPDAAVPSNFIPHTQDELENLDSDGDGDIDHHDLDVLKEGLTEHLKSATPSCPECPEPECPDCPDCPHPSEHNPQWEKHAVLNDTRKHHNGFKLFAELHAPPSDFPARFAVHARQYEGRKDIWNIKLFPSVMEDALQEMGVNYTDVLKVAPPSAKAQMEEMRAFNAHQPRWNLANNRLETRSNDSAPVNDTLYLRLFEDKDVKDTSQSHGKVYRTMLTTNPTKKKYNKEHNAKLIANKSWQLVRDADPSLEYFVRNKDTKGGFFWCVDQGRMAVMEIVSKKVGSGEEMELPEFIAALQTMGDHNGAELKYMDSNQSKVQLSKSGATCLAVDLKVR